MDQKTLKKLAAQFDTLAETILAISGTFRAASGGDADSGGDAPAGKPVRGTKPATVAKGKPAADEAAAETEYTEDDVREALTELLELRGKEVMVAALETVGAGKLADVDESQYGELMEAVAAAKEEEPAEAPKPKSKTKPAAKPKGPTLEETQAAAQALIDVDKPAYLKLAKKLGKPSEMEASDYAAAIEAYTAAMPEEEPEGLL